MFKSRWEVVLQVIGDLDPRGSTFKLSLGAFKNLTEQDCLLANRSLLSLFTSCLLLDK